MTVSDANTQDEKRAEAAAFGPGYYSDHAFGHWARHPYRKHNLRHLFAFLRTKPDVRRVVELCCGCGVNLYHLVAEFPHLSVAGCDLSPEGIALASRSVAGGAFTVGDAEHAPYPDGSADLVLAVAAVHHFARDPRQFLSECVRILRPGGYLFVREPHNLASVSPVFEDLERETRATLRKLNPPKGTGKPTPRAKTEGAFDQDQTERALAALGMELCARGHSDYLAEWARGMFCGFRLAVAFDDIAVSGGTKYWAIWQRRGKHG